MVTAWPNVADWLAEVSQTLDDEVRFHLVHGVGNAWARDATRRADQPLLVTVADDGGVAVAAMMTPPHPLIVATHRESAGAGLRELVIWLRDHAILPGAAIADLPHASDFATSWQESGGAATVRMEQRLHVLRAVSQMNYRAPGTLRRAGPRDLEMLTRWMHAFNKDALGAGPDPELRASIDRRVAAGEIYLWYDGGEPRSMAASARPTKRGIAINSVYTPPEWRGHGYATGCVASLSGRMLREGREFCVLYTDLSNPTSNAIYARIGYQPVSDSHFLKLQ
jgi:GNAT superfamily N-acetyltransferase